MLDDLTSRAYCSVLDVKHVGEALLVHGAIDEVDLEDRAPEPLVYLRGYYRGVRPLPDRTARLPIVTVDVQPPVKRGH